MKKYLIFFALSLFFIFPFSANAASKNVRIDFDSHEKFNYFYEQKNSTPFYHFLVSQGDDLPTILNDYTSNRYSSGGGNLRIYYSWELLLDFMPEDTKYIIVVDTIPGTPSLNYNGKNLSISSYFSNSNNPFCFGRSDIIFYFFDSSAVYLGSSIRDYATSFEDTTVGCNLIQDNTYDISKLDSSDFTYFISKYYMFNNTLNWNNNTDIIVSDLLLDGEVYLIDDNQNYSNFWAAMRKIFSFGDVKDYDVSESSLQFFKENKVYSKSNKVLSLYDMVVINENSSLPNNYVSVNFLNYNNGFYLVPKRKIISSRYYIAQPTNKNVVLSAKVYDISTDNIIYTTDNDYFNTVIDFNYLDECVISSDLYDCAIVYLPESSESPENLLSNYIYYFSVNSNKYDFWFYYNSLDFDLFPYTDGTSDFSFVNPNTGNDITFGSQLQQDYFINVNSYSSSYVKDNSISLNDFDLSSSGIFNTVTDFVTGFVPTVTSIFTLVFLVFSALPPELQYLFYFLFIAGIIIIIFNLIRGR